MPKNTNGVTRRRFLQGAAAIGAGVATGLSGRFVPVRAQSSQVEFWDMVWGPAEYPAAAEALVQQFNAAMPQVQVTYQSTPWTNWYQTFLTAIGSGTAPDISTGAGYQAVQFYDFGAIRPIDDLLAEMDADGELADFLPGTLDRMLYQGVHVALPWAIDIRVLYYRTDLFEEAGLQAPRTWDDVLNAAEKLTSGDRYGFVIPSDTMGTHNLYMFMINNGGGLFDENGALDLWNERNVEALEFIATMVRNGWMHPGSAGFQGVDADRAFGQGTAAMMVQSPRLGSRLPEIASVIGLAEPLEGPHGDRGTISWVNNIMIYTQSDDPEATKSFLRWYSANGKPLFTDGLTNQFPVRASIATDDFFRSDPQLSRIQDEYIPVGRSTAARNATIFPALNEVEGEGVMHTLIQDLLQGVSVSDALTKAEGRLQAIVG